MKKSRFTEEQIIRALQQLDGGMSAKDVARDLGVNVQTLYRWRKKFGGMDVSDARRLRQLEDENRRLKRLVAELTLDKQALQDIASPGTDIGSSVIASVGKAIATTGRRSTASIAKRSCRCGGERRNGPGAVLDGRCRRRQRSTSVGRWTSSATTCRTAGAFAP